MSYVRVGILGTTAGGEVWSINPVFDPTGEFPGTPNQAALDAAALAIANLDPGSTMLSMLSTQLSVTGAKVEVRTDVGDELLGISQAGATSAAVGQGLVRLPPQSAIVISLRTNTPGARGRGRLYWPAVGLQISSDFRVGQTVPPLLLAEFKTYLQAIGGILAGSFTGIGFNLAIRSKAAQATPHVVRLQMGDIVDTQRRRRDALKESYQSVAY